jgi:hypothetical protein
MKGQILAAAAILLATATAARATNVLLNLQTTTDATGTSGTWTVTATLSDNQTLGIASFSIDVLGSSFPGSPIVQKASGTNSNTPPTLLVSNPPYSMFRINGTLSPPNLVGISASQDIVTAANNNDPSVLRFGDGLTAAATGAVYGTVAPGGALTLATGRWTTTFSSGLIEAVLTPGAFFNLFPLNYAVDDGTAQFNPPPPGTVRNLVAAANVLSSGQFVPAFPEPSALIIVSLGGLSTLPFCSRHRRARKSCKS